MNEILVNIITTVLTGLLSILAVVVINYVTKLITKAKANANKIEDETAMSMVNTALDNLQELIKTNVTSAEVTLKQEIIKASKDGKLTKEDAISLKNTVKDNIIKQLSTSSYELLKLELNDVESYIENKIEVVLASIKGQI